MDVKEYSITDWLSVQGNSIKHETLSNDTQTWKVKRYYQGDYECFCVAEKYENDTLIEQKTFDDFSEVQTEFNNL